MREFAPDLDLSKETADFLEWEISWRDGVHAVRGAEELLERLPANVWAVVTSAERELAKARFSAACLPMPEVLISAEDVSQGKPNPEGFLKAAEQLSVQASNCVVFEDSRAGIKAGEKSGASVVLVAIDGNPPLEVGKYAIRDFTDLDLTIDNQCITIRF
jgi:sugar-phosphatase